MAVEQEKETINHAHVINLNSAGSLGQIPGASVTPECLYQSAEILTGLCRADQRVLLGVPL